MSDEINNENIEYIKRNYDDLINNGKKELSKNNLEEGYISKHISDKKEMNKNNLEEGYIGEYINDEIIKTQKLEDIENIILNIIRSEDKERENYISEREEYKRILKFDIYLLLHGIDIRSKKYKNYSYKKLEKKLKIMEKNKKLKENKEKIKKRKEKVKKFTENIKNTFGM